MLHFVAMREAFKNEPEIFTTGDGEGDGEGLGEGEGIGASEPPVE